MTLRTRAEAKANAPYGCRLATMSDDTERKALETLYAFVSGNFFHVGLSRPPDCPISDCGTKDASAGWFWEDDCTVYDKDETPWKFFEPNNSGDEYVVVFGGGNTPLLNDVGGKDKFFSMYECCESE